MRTRIMKKIWVWVLICTMLFQNVAYAGQWKQENTDWYYEQDGVRQKGWVSDETGKYRLDDNGTLQSGWYLEGETWYFLNTVHDGYFGRALTNQWAWIDGYCYLFDAEGKMYAGCTTPDGYEVNADGRWTVDGVVQYVEGKGILTVPLAVGGSSGSPSGGGSSGGGGGGSHSGGSSSGGSGGSGSGGSSGGSSSEEEPGGSSGEEPGGGSEDEPGGGSEDEPGGGSDSEDRDTVTFPEYEGVKFDSRVTMQTLEFFNDAEASTVTVFDLAEVESWKAGEIHILHDQVSSENDIAIRVLSVEPADSGAVVYYEQPQLEEVVDSIDLSGAVDIAEVGGTFVPAEDVTASSSASSAKAMARSRSSGGMEVAGPISFTYNPNGNPRITGSYQLDRLFYDFQMETVDGELRISRCSVVTDSTVTLRVSADKNKEIEKMEIKLGELKLPLSIPGFFAELTLWAEPFMKGGGGIICSFELKSGITLEEDGDWSPVFESKPFMKEMELYGTAGIMLGIGMPVTFLNFELVDAGAKAGLEVSGEMKPVIGTLQFCCDAGIDFVCDIYAELTKMFTMEWNVFRGHLWDIHIEETGIVDECSREFEYSYGGIIMDDYTGVPIPGVKVVVENQDSEVVDCVYTDESGRFYGYTELPDGWNMTFSALGYNGSRSINFSNVYNLRITLAPIDYEDQPGVVIYVYDVYTREPIPNAKVECSLGGITETFTTDATGYGVKYGLAPGTYSCRISAEGYDTYESNAGVKISTYLSKTNFSLKPNTKQWSVQIYEEYTGWPFSNAYINVQREGEMEILEVVKGSVSAHPGFYEGREELEEGKYVLSVYNNSYKDVEIPLEIVDGEVQNLQIFISSKYTNSLSRYWNAYVTDAETEEPIPWASICLMAKSLSTKAYTNDSGFCRGNSYLPSGEYRAWVQADGYETLVTTVKVSDDGGSVYYWKLNPHRKSTISESGVRGYIQCSEDRYWYVPDATIEFYSGGELMGQTASGEDGYFECELEEGEYSMRVSADGYIQQEMDVRSTAKGRDVYEVDLEMETYSVEFHLATADGRIPDTVYSQLSMVEGRYWLDNPPSTSLVKEGEIFKAELASGTYTLSMNRILLGNEDCDPQTVTVKVDKDHTSFDITVTGAPAAENAELLGLEILEEVLEDPTASPSEIPEEDPTATPSDLPETDLDKDDDDEKPDTVLDGEEPANPAEKADGGTEPEDPEIGENPETGDGETGAGEDGENDLDSGEIPEPDTGSGNPLEDEEDPDEESEPDAGEPSGEEGDSDEEPEIQE